MAREMHNNLVPAEPTHPGDVLKDELDARGMTQTDLARHRTSDPDHQHDYKGT